MRRTISALIASWGSLAIGCGSTESTKVVEGSAQTSASSTRKPDLQERNPEWVSTPAWAARAADRGRHDNPERSGPRPACASIGLVLIEPAGEGSWTQFESALARLQIDVKPGQSAVLPRWIGRRLRESVQNTSSLRTSPEVGLTFGSGRGAEFGSWVGEEGVPGSVGFFRAERLSARDCELRFSIQAARKGRNDSGPRETHHYWRIDDRVTLKPGECYISPAEATDSARPMAVLVEVIEVWPDGMPIASAESAAIHGVARRID